MLDWLACRFAPKLTNLTDVPAPPLPDPCPQDELLDRARATFAELAAIPFTAHGVSNPYRLLLGMGCRDLLTREADQHPDTAGRTPHYARYPAFQPLEIPLEGGLVLTGHHSTGAPGAPIVLIAHGIFDSHVSLYVVELAEVLRRWGFHVVALDLRDHGRRLGQGPPVSMGLHEGQELLAAARALARTEGVSVGLLGLSFGGHCVVRAAHEATLAGCPEVLRGGVMAIGAPLSVHEALMAFDDPTRLPRPHGLLDKLVLRELIAVMRRHLRLRAGVAHLPSDDAFAEYARRVILPAYPQAPPLLGAFMGQARCTRPDVMGSLAVPVALVHPVDDPLVPVAHLREALAAAGDNPFVFGRELPCGGHVCLAPVDPAGTLALIGTFFGRLRDG